MEKGLLFVGLLLILSFSVFVTATHDDSLDSNDFFYCHDSDDVPEQIIDEKTYIINNPINLENEDDTFYDINTGESFVLERGYFNSMAQEEQDDGTYKIILRNKEEGRVFGNQNFFEKGITYGKEKIYDNDFVTKEDSCVMLEKFYTEIFEATSVEEAISLESELKTQEDFREKSGAVYYSFSDGSSYTLACADGDCDSARVNECSGENCGVLEFACSKSFSFFDYFKYVVKHPTKIFSFFGEDFGTNVNRNVHPCQNGCFEGVCIK